MCPHVADCGMRSYAGSWVVDIRSKSEVLVVGAVLQARWLLWVRTRSPTLWRAALLSVA